ncbi:glycosyltransferase involved in cell wall biosynthesis [Marmoricola sp. OAE513]|uniref:glycosyltransferase family 2 protein n=1 Tax=Marmoricola sp. OAE513 TaxID=2817894 RepID=UPI00339A15F8
MAAGSRFKRGVRKLGGSTLVAFERSRLRPELTVVMPVYNVAPFLREALDSALNGTLHDIELVAVDDGSTDECLEILREYERRDSRVRVFTQANAGQGTARNVGVSHARAEFLTFMDSDDTIPPEAFEHMVGHLRRSGSDFCVGGVRRFRGGRMIRTSWQRTVHQADRIATTIEEFPAAMQDIIACNRVFRTAFWREQVGDFRGGIAYEDHVPMLAAYVRARTFDVLAEVTYNWRIRENSTGQQKARLQNLLDRIEVKEEAHALLQAEASDFTYDVWVARCLEVDFPPFVGRALDGDDTYRATLAAAYRTFVERATDRAWDRVRVATKVRAHLVATERWDDVVAAMTYFISVNQVPPTRVTDGVLVAVLPDAPWAAGLPPHLLRMADLESHFQGVVEKVRRDGTALEVVGWMRHRGLDAPAPEISLELRSGEHRVPLGLENLVLPQANLWAPLPTSGCAHAGFRARIPLEQLRATAGPWSLVGSTTTDGLTSTGDFHYAVPGSSAERSRSFDVEIAGARLGGADRLAPEPRLQPAAARGRAEEPSGHPDRTTDRGGGPRGRRGRRHGQRSHGRAARHRRARAGVRSSGGGEQRCRHCPVRHGHAHPG